MQTIRQTCTKLQMQQANIPWHTWHVCNLKIGKLLGSGGNLLLQPMFLPLVLLSLYTPPLAVLALFPLQQNICKPLLCSSHATTVVATELNGISVSTI